MRWDLIIMDNLESMIHIFNKNTHQFSSKHYSINSLLMSNVEKFTQLFYAVMAQLFRGEVMITVNAVVETLVPAIWLLYSVQDLLTLKVTTDQIFNKSIVVQSILLLLMMLEDYLLVAGDSRVNLVLDHLLMSQHPYMCQKFLIK